MTYNGIAEVRSYNSMLQLIGLSSGSYVNMQYVYPAGANNGKVCLQSDLISHEQSQYGYDMQNRLSSATAWTISGQPSGSCTFASGSLTWGQSYTYDGYGSLTDKNVTAGSAPSLHVTVDPATNRVTGQYDANGNMTAMAGNVSLGYDSENRLVQWINYNSGTSARHGYDSQNKRVWVWSGGADQWGNPNSYQVYFYGLNGKRLGVYQVSLVVAGPGSGHPVAILDAASATETYFGSRRLSPMDRLGSVPNPGGSSGHSTYYPYGEDKAGNPGGDGWKFATYSRDGGSGLDYADQRYYASSLGRFMSPDPYMAATLLANNSIDPLSWNRYPYVMGDPVNRKDPRGWISIAADQDGEDEGPPDEPLDPLFRRPQQPAPKPKDCFVTVFYREVIVGGIEVGNHAYVWVGDENDFHHILEGEPERFNPLSPGNLKAYWTLGDGGYKDSDHPYAGDQQWGKGRIGADICDYVRDLLDDTKHFDNISLGPHGYNGFFGPTSNSFASFILHYEHLGFGKPPDAPGWGALDYLIGPGRD